MEDCVQTGQACPRSDSRCGISHWLGEMIWSSRKTSVKGLGGNSPVWFTSQRLFKEQTIPAMPPLQERRNVRRCSFSQICSYNQNKTKKRNRLDVESSDVSVKQMQGVEFRWDFFCIISIFCRPVKEKRAWRDASSHPRARAHTAPSYLRTSTYIILSQFHHSCCPHQRIPATAAPRPLPHTNTHDN